MYTDSELLRQYVKDGSEAAFTELIQRYAGLVYSAALRTTGGKRHLADEVTQDVFTLLVRKAPALLEYETLAGWLYRSTRYVALRALHKIRKQEIREQEAIAMQTHSAPDIQWEQLRPLLDEAMERLDEPDRQAVLLRYFQGWSHREVGTALGLSENTARARTDRAVEKLHRYFARSGVVTTGALLAQALSANAAQAAPVGLVGKVATASFVQAKGLGFGHSLLKAFYMTTKTKIITVAVVIVAAMAVPLVQQHQTIAQLNNQLARVQKTKAASASDLDDQVAKVKATIAKLRKIRDHEVSYEKIRNYIAGLDVGIIQALINDPTSTSLLKENTNARSALVARWAELDHTAALAWAIKYDNDKSTLIDIYDAWSESDPAGALAALPELQLKGDDYSNTLRFIIGNYFEKDPAAAYAALRNLPYNQTYELYPRAFEIWAWQDPVAAATAALNLPSSSIRDSTLDRIAYTWSLTDSAAALAWAKNLPPSAGKNDALAMVVIDLGHADPVATAAAFASYNIPPGYVHNDALNSIASSYAEIDPAGALQWADKNLTGGDYQTATVSILLAISKTDPAAAAADLAKISDSGVFNAALENFMLQNWTQQDPQAALAWAQALPADNLSARNAAIAQVFSSWTATDPAAAGNYILQNFTTDPAYNTLATQVAASLAKADPEGAFKWALSLPTGGGARINAITTALGALTDVDPQAAWQDAQKLTGGSNAARAEASVISSWANQQPAQAAAALPSLSEGTYLDTATANVAKSWLSQDPNAASQWINTLAPGSARDGAVSQIISTVGSSDPAGAFNWALSLGNETTRATQVVKLATQWSKQNPAAAATAAQNALGNLSGLTTDQQTALQKIVTKATTP